MATTHEDMPEGYVYEKSSSAFPEHVGRSYHKWVERPDGDREYRMAIRIEPHHVNTWGFAHGGFMAAVSEMMSSGPAYVVGGPPVVAIEMSMQFVRAPKVGDLIETRGNATRRTRSLVFTRAEAFVGNDLIFSATAVHKVVNA